MRMLHTMLRVGNLEKSLQFYKDVLGMKLLRKHDYPEHEFSLAYLGYGDESETTVLELTHNWGTESYDLGNAYGHIAIGVDDVYKACTKGECQLWIRLKNWVAMSLERRVLCKAAIR